MSQPKPAYPSELFMDLVCNMSTPSIECQLCGRCHFATGSQSDLFDDNIQNLRKKAAESPDKYVECHDDSVAFGHIEGRQVVWNCPCGKLARYETWIWEHRELILDYIRARSNRELAEAQRLLERMPCQTT